MNKQAVDNQPDTEIRKIPESNLFDSVERLKVRKDDGILSFEEEADLNELEQELDRRKIAGKIPGVPDGTGPFGSGKKKGRGLGYCDNDTEEEKTAMSDGDLIPGGLADDYDVIDFDKDALEAGAKVEMEHTKDSNMAREIAMDHLSEDPEYYKKLKQIEGICDSLEEERYYESDPEIIIAKVAKKYNVHKDEVQEHYYSRYIK